MRKVEEIPPAERPQALAKFQELAQSARRDAEKLAAESLRSEGAARNFQRRADDQKRASLAKTQQAEHWNGFVARLEALNT